MSKGRGKSQGRINYSKNGTSGRCKYLLFLYVEKGKMELHSRLLNISQLTVFPQKINKKSETCKIKEKIPHRNPASN